MEPSRLAEPSWAALIRLGSARLDTAPYGSTRLDAAWKTCHFASANRENLAFWVLCECNPTYHIVKSYWNGFLCQTYLKHTLKSEILFHCLEKRQKKAQNFPSRMKRLRADEPSHIDAAQLQAAEPSRSHRLQTLIYIFHGQNEDKMLKNRLRNGLVALQILEYSNIYYIKGHTTPFSANFTITHCLCVILV